MSRPRKVKVEEPVVEEATKVDNETREEVVTELIKEEPEKKITKKKEKPVELKKVETLDKVIGIGGFSMQ